MVVLKSNNTETKTTAFCAGGDVVALATGEGGVVERAQFLKREYVLNHLIGTYQKPIISILDGITSTARMASRVP